MKIGVCVKITPDTDTRIKIQGDGIDANGIKWVVSPYDALAVEEAIVTGEKHGAEVVSFTIGDESTQAVLRGNVLAPGVARSVVVSEAAALKTDSLGRARVLAAAIGREACDVVFCGKVGIDHDNAQVPAMVGELLGWPVISRVTTFSAEGGRFRATRNVDGGVVEVVEGPLPAIMTAERGLNTPRYAKLPQLTAAKKKPIDTPSLADLGLSADVIAPAVTMTAWDTPPPRPKGRILQGDVDTVVDELVRLLREEAKVL